MIYAPERRHCIQDKTVNLFTVVLFMCCGRDCDCNDYV